ncbi:FadR/GntR family transcriptional regulator [Anaerocolumna xylanovorans]|uniref:GntR family transcriptional regulator, transcriptional repressor for pyruvate dehydrogenase complex n=1 Tax=Anaerocolumna xylanovorans DSM 12503 TaxID=1121345 RepID=A0A1M7XW04_9FIRM|nr:FadR/GntR family transcriptional regulator [Anaerocolumna xylanovorans]SHO42904.1 GntR family transcriptional regulator, transcriptional repressor for pyruvate dehydrogenase complex [Anaerocolumna xylanovorans DSM 12503]
MEEHGTQEKSYMKVIDYIKRQIRRGELTLGGKLPAERELSETLGISRNSVREAIRTLDIMGVISSQQGAGNFLTGNFENNLVESLSMMFLLNQIDYKQVSQLRRALEMEALMLAIDNITEAEIQTLKQVISQLENETEANNVVLDKKMHYNIALASKNTLIINILEALSEVLDKFIVDLRREILSQDDSRKLLMEAHNGMIESLITKDKNLAYESINKHFGVIDEKLKENE